MEIINNVKTLLDAGVASAAPNILIEGGIPYVVVPENYRVKQLEDMLPTPVRKRSKVTTTDTKGFIFYTQKHGQDGQTVIYADIDGEASKFNLVAVLDDHGTAVSDTQWRDHRCQFEPDQAVEWKRWIGKNKAVFSQAEFATWLEDNLADIATVPIMPTVGDITGDLNFAVHGPWVHHNRIRLCKLESFFGETPLLKECIALWHLPCFHPFFLDSERHHNINTL